VLTEEQVKSVVEMIEHTRLAPGLITHLKHTENVRQIMSDKNTRFQAGSKTVAASVSQTIDACPLCGAVMVERVARRGKNLGEKFWGCSGYPNCRGRRRYTGLPA
jgi:hypothetical protein